MCIRDRFNSGAATVNLQETAMTVKESAGLCTVPVVVTGEHTGDVYKRQHVSR